MAVDEFTPYALTGMPTVIDRDENGLYFINTETGVKLYLLSKLDKSPLPLEVENFLSTHPDIDLSDLSMFTGDVDDLGNGFVYVTGGADNLPIASSGSVLTRRLKERGTQLFHSITSNNNVYIRIFDKSNWLRWEKLAKESDIPSLPLNIGKRKVFTVDKDYTWTAQDVKVITFNEGNPTKNDWETCIKADIWWLWNTGKFNKFTSLLHLENVSGGSAYLSAFEREESNGDFIVDLTPTTPFTIPAGAKLILDF